MVRIKKDIFLRVVTLSAIIRADARDSGFDSNQQLRPEPVVRGMPTDLPEHLRKTPFGPIVGLHELQLALSAFLLLLLPDVDPYTSPIESDGTHAVPWRGYWQGLDRE